MSKSKRIGINHQRTQNVRQDDFKVCADTFSASSVVPDRYVQHNVGSVFHSSSSPMTLMDETLMDEIACPVANCKSHRECMSIG